MKTHSVKISGLEQVNGEVCVQLKTQPFLQPSAGQFFQAFAADSEDLLPTLLYPCRVSSTELLLCGDIPKSWTPGTDLHLRGPRGNGFHLPPMTRRLALTSLDQCNANRLLALADTGLANRTEVSLFTNQHPSDLAPEIEVLPLEELTQAKDWADFLAAVLQPGQINAFRNCLKLIPGRKTPFTVEILLEISMICDESSACGVCSVYTNRGWRMACKDGPVFALDDLPGEDGSLG
ncbi:MAG: iron-sulfur cluster-binding protein [Anaerolineaceae bacterium]